jgi:ubiquinone/menaquinone biosynthesis C-methylase UbiE
MSKQRTYNRIARLYDLLDLPFEHLRYKPVRKIVFSDLSGDVLDAGVGTGRNMSHYPDDAAMTGIDLSPAMLARAGQRQRRLSVAVDLHQADIMATGFDDHSFDAIVATFLFCVLDPDHQTPALIELNRICRPGGEIRIIEYAISEHPVRRTIMRLWAPWVRWAYGAAFNRNTEQYLDAAGLELVESRFIHRDIIKLLVVRRKA